MKSVLKKYHGLFLLLAVFLLAFFLRVVLLSSVPNGLQQDELNAGYQGYKLITTGSDLRGEFFPLYINRFGDYRPAGIFYLDGISTLLFGLNTFAIRFPAALFGAASVIALYFLTKELSKSRVVAYMSALLLAISPWHIVTSRATSEQVVALFFIIIGALFTLRGCTKERKREFIFAGISFLISYFFYHTPRVFVPAFLMLFSLTARFYPSFLSLKKSISFRSLLWLLTICMCVVTLGLSLTKEGTGRLAQTSVWGDPTVKSTIGSLSDAEKNNILAARIFDNKAIIYGKTILNQYLNYFSINFLYIQGGLPERYVVPQMGLFYYIELPLLLIGCYFLVKRKDPFYLVPLLWLLVGPLAASVTTEDIPNIQRALFMLPAFQIIEAYGVYFGLKMLSTKAKYLVSIVGVILLLGNIIYFWHAYTIFSPSNQSYLRDDGNKTLFSTLQAREKDASVIYVPSYQDLPLYYSYFYFQKTSLLSYTQKNIDSGFTVGKYDFLPDQCPERLIDQNKLPSQNVLIVDFDHCPVNDHLHPVQIIRRQDDTTAYIISSYH